MRGERGVGGRKKDLKDKYKIIPKTILLYPFRRLEVAAIRRREERIGWSLE